MDYRKIIADAVPEFVFDARKNAYRLNRAGGVSLEESKYNIFYIYFNLDLNEIIMSKPIIKYKENSSFELHESLKTELENLIKKIQDLIYKSSDIKLYEIAFTLSESRCRGQFHYAFNFLKSKLIETIPKTGLSEIKQILKSSLKFELGNRTNKTGFSSGVLITSKSGKRFGRLSSNVISEENLMLMIETANTDNLLFLLKDFSSVQCYHLRNSRFYGKFSYSFNAFIPVLEAITNQTKLISEINEASKSSRGLIIPEKSEPVKKQDETDDSGFSSEKSKNQIAEFNKLNLDIKQETLELENKVLREKNKALKIKNQLLLKQQGIANKIIN